MPVHGGEAETRRCLQSLLASQVRAAFEVIVIDDASPQAYLSAWLADEAAAGRITLLRNDRNLGFVASANRGMRQHPERDVVLLNSDTEVANDWLDRLMRCARSASDIATVTPFSNSGTICSYPFDGWTGDLPGGLGLARLDGLFAGVHAGVYIDLPTAVGFCMFIRRACLDEVGAFDERRFGRGYGEENDFSLRAAKAGWRNVLCADTFIYHRGSVSFGKERFARMKEGERALLEVHPDYHARVGAFIEADPLRPLCRAVDCARIACGEAEAAAVSAERATERGVGHEGVSIQAGSIDDNAPAHLRHRFRRPVLLHVMHGWGGGVARWTQDFVNADDAGWNLLLRSRSTRNDAGAGLDLIDPAAGETPLLTWDLDEPIAFTAVGNTQYREILQALIDGFEVKAVLVSSLIGHTLDALETGLATAVVLHDFYPFCPALFAWFGQPCTRCGPTELRECLQRNPHNVFWHQHDVGAWQQLRDEYGARIAADDVRIAAPSHAVHERYAALFPPMRDKPWRLIPHGLDRAHALSQNRDGAWTPPNDERRLRVLVPGRLSLHKGLYLLRDALPELLEFADILLLGAGHFGRPFSEMENVRVVPDYDDAGLGSAVDEFAPDCALLLSILPETFSYTLSEMNALGVPVVATRLGAFVERISDGDNGFLVEPEPHALVSRLRAFAADRSPLAQVARVLRATPVRGARKMVGDYRHLLGLDDGAAATARAPGKLAAKLAEELACARTIGEWRFAQHGQNHGREAAIDAGVDVGVAAERDALRHEVASLREDLRASRGAAEERRAEADVLALHLREAAAERDALRASTSWRMTKPLRALRALLLGTATSDAAEAVAMNPAEPVAVASDPDHREIPPERDDHVIGPTHSAEPLIAVRKGDPVACRRAGRLAAALGLAVTEIDVAGLRIHAHVDAGASGAGASLQRELSEACALVFGEAGEGGQVVAHSVCFEGIEQTPGGREAATAVAVAANFLVPMKSASRQLIDALCPAVGKSGFDLAVKVFPLAGDWQDCPSRSSIRLRQRDALGVPDMMRIVIGLGRADARSGLLRFAQVAAQMTAAVNGCCFVWLGGRDDAWISEHPLEIGLPVAQGKLYLLDETAFEPWLLAADAYLGCRADGVYDAGAAEALAAGLPVAVECAGSLPDALRTADLADVLDIAVGDDALPCLAAWTSEPLKSRTEAATCVRARFGSDEAMAAFAAALGNQETSIGKSCRPT